MQPGGAYNEAEIRCSMAFEGHRRKNREARLVFFFLRWRAALLAIV
jgi:hypothetical protein